MGVADLFESNLALIDRVILGVCRRAKMYGAEAEDFASAVRLALIENDYAILRPFEGRSSLSTFLAVIVQRFLFDEITRRAGRWHPSRDAERLGAAGIALERILHREQRSIDEALPILQSIDPTLTRERIVEMEKCLPARTPRPRTVDLALSEERLVAAERSDERVVVADIERVSDRAGRVIRETLETMTVEDRMIVRLHFASSMSIKTISGLLRLPQRPLYRRMESLLLRLRNALGAAQIDSRDAADLIGSATREMDFGLQDPENEPVCRTNPLETPDEVEEAR